MLDEPSTSFHYTPPAVSPSTQHHSVTPIYCSIEAIFRRPFCVIVLLFMFVISCSARGKCFNTPMGMSIETGNYRRIRDFSERECARECVDDFSCFGYEWDSVARICYLKSRSTTGKLVEKGRTIMGFCIDDEDDTRFRLNDHIIIGPPVFQSDHVADNDDCKEMCQKIEVSYYSWVPNEGIENQEESEDMERFGKCTCISTLTEVRLEYDAFSGFVLPNLKRKHRRSVFMRKFE